MIDWKKWSMFGVLTGLFAYGVSWLIGLLKIPILEWGVKAGGYDVGGTFATIDFPVRPLITSQGAIPAAGQWFLDLLGGKLPMSAWITSILALVIGGAVLILAGALIAKLLGAARLKDWQELLVVFGIAAVVGSIVFMGMTSLSLWTGVVSMILYFAGIAGLMLLVNKLSKGVFPRIPTL